MDRQTFNLMAIGTHVITRAGLPGTIADFPSNAPAFALVDMQDGPFMVGCGDMEIDTTNELANLKAAINDILVDANGHYRTEMSGADTVEALTILAEVYGCLTLCSKGCNGEEGVCEEIEEDDK